MSTQTLLASMFRYKAWADEGLLAGLAAAAHRMPGPQHRAALRILDHAHAVDCIFAAHLQRKAHGYAATHCAEEPDADRLREAMRKTDRWFIDHAQRLDPQDLSETIAFDFTDGAHGRMSREEMLGHVIAHGGYHRGEVGQILAQCTGSSPRDTFTGYLHEMEPARRTREA